MKDISKIPNGGYCYKTIHVNPETGKMRLKKCPYWASRPEHGAQNSGYCGYLEKGDWESELSFLWDMVKECDVNLDDDFLERYL